MFNDLKFYDHRSKENCNHHFGGKTESSMT